LRRRDEPLARFVEEGETGGRGGAVEEALAFMRENFTHSVGLAEVAEAVHVSAPHLSRLFRRETGRTLTDYLQALRISRAREQLAETDDGILTVALACGFQTPEHFFRTFKKRMKITPRAYRLAQRA